jgi:xylitol oxidase
MRAHNWAGNVAFGAARIHQPTSVEELQQIVAAAPRIRVLGSGHSFNAIADSAELVCLRGLAGHVEIDRAAGTVTCPAGLTYGELAPRLHAEGLALANLGSLPHISIGGSIATATHGSGDQLGNLATAVAALELVTASGEVRRTCRADPEFNGFAVALGALGAVTRVTLDVEPTYEMRQDIYERLSWRALDERFDEITASGDSVSVFTRWGEHAGQLWVKRRADRRDAPAPRELFGARAAPRQRHPITNGDPAACTLQGGIVGPWHERLPHFRLEFTPSAGEELQSEYLLPRVNARGAIDAVRGLAARIEPLLHVSEIRTVAADELWMSPQHGRETVAIHFTWRHEQERVAELLVELEDALLRFAARPHWGKLFAARAGDLAPRYPRFEDFVALRARLDRRGAFRNDWLETRVLGAGA